MAITKAKLVPRQRQVERGDEIYRDYFELNLSQRQIAKKYGISQTKVSMVLAELRRDMGELTKEKLAEDRVQRMVAQLDALTARYLPPALAGDYDSARLVLQIHERFCRLTGLDAPRPAFGVLEDGKPTLNILVQDQAVLDSL